MVIHNEFEIGDIVYLITDSNHSFRLVTGFKVTLNDVKYILGCEHYESLHESIEISKEKNIL